MAKRAYKEHRFSIESSELIRHVNTIAAAYARQGFSLSLRQIYYQMVSKNLITNTLQSYSRLGDVVTLGRMAGLIDWNTVVDRTREVHGNSHWDNPEAIVDICAKTFAIDKWDNQRTRVEVWIEKQALEDVVRHACEPLDVRYIACRGYMSITAMYEAAQRYITYINDGQDVVIIHLGDHDPSGIDMSRDILDRLETFCEQSMDVNRIALNMDQITVWNPPANPAKMTDSRFKSYMDKYGTSSWELDAIPPDVLSDMITDAVMPYRDEDVWDAAVAEENDAKKKLAQIAGNWDKVVALLANPAAMALAQLTQPADADEED